jgi:hypothetical protein
MSAAGTARLMMLAVAGLNVVLNLLSLASALPRIRQHMLDGVLSEHFADVLRAVWGYASAGHLALAAVLIGLGLHFPDGGRPAWTVATTIAVYYVLLGPFLFALSIQPHPGFLAFSAIGLALLIPLWVARPL